MDLKYRVVGGEHHGYRVFAPKAQTIRLPSRSLAPVAPPENVPTIDEEHISTYNRYNMPPIDGGGVPVPIWIPEGVSDARAPMHILSYALMTPADAAKHSNRARDAEEARNLMRKFMVAHSRTNPRDKVVETAARIHSAIENHPSSFTCVEALMICVSAIVSDMPNESMSGDDAIDALAELAKIRRAEVEMERNPIR